MPRSCFLCVKLDELKQGIFDSHEVFFVREHVVSLLVDEGERVGAFEQLEGFHHVGEGYDIVLHSCDHAHGSGAGDGYFGLVEQVVFSGFFEEGFREDVSLFGGSIGFAPSSDLSLLYFLLFFFGKFDQEEFFWKVESGRDQQQSYDIFFGDIFGDILLVSFEDMESDPSTHGGSCDDPGLLRRDIFLCVF